MVQWPNSPLCHANMSWNYSNKCHNSFVCFSSRDALDWSLPWFQSTYPFPFWIPFLLMSILEKDEMEIQNTCLQDIGFFLLLLLEQTKSNLHNYHPLCTILLTTFVVVPTTPNLHWCFISHPSFIPWLFFSIIFILLENSYKGLSSAFPSTSLGSS